MNNFHPGSITLLGLYNIAKWSGYNIKRYTVFLLHAMGDIKQRVLHNMCLYISNVL